MNATDAALRAGVILSGRAVSANRLLNVISILLPMLGSAVALLAWNALAPTAATLWIFLAFFVLELFGLGVGMHRYFTHRAFQTGAGLRWLLAITGSWAFQGSIERWVADHRRHHRFADRPFDPHSPHWVEEQPPRSRLAGLYHAHLGWMFRCPLTDPKRYASDIQTDPITHWCSRHYWGLCASSVLLPAAVGFGVGGPAEALRGLLFGGFLRVALLQQLTWSVNSIGHSFGRRPADARDQSRDIPFFAVVLFGEGLHAYHHRHPSAAVNEPRALDLNGAVLRGLEKLGLVWDLKRFD